MKCFRYTINHPLRVLLLISAAYLSLPIILPDVLLNFYTIPVFYFYGAYFFLINFPNISIFLYSKPLYIQDLILVIGEERDPVFKKMYEIIMIFILSILFAFFAEYALIRGIRDKPVIEILGIIGGNISLYAKTQGIVGQILLYFCHHAKQAEMFRRIESRRNSRMNSPYVAGKNGSDVELPSLNINETLTEN